MPPPPPPPCSSPLRAAAQAAYAKATHAPTLPSRAQLPLFAAWLLRAGWQPDGDAAACGACGAPFDAVFRRHHCRLTGRVVCTRCSTKLASLGWADGGRPTRVCDAAYNALMTVEAAGDAAGGAGGIGDVRAPDLAPESPSPLPTPHARGSPAATATAATAAAAASASRGLGGAAAGRFSLMGGRPGSAAAAAAKVGAKPAPSAGATSASAAGTMSEALSELHERGEKLNNLNERVAEMHTEAQSFYDMARQIRQASERQSRWF